MRTILNSLLAVTFLLLVAPRDGWSQDTGLKVLTLSEAQQISDAAEKRAQQDQWNVVIAVVDAGGHLLTLRRMDNAQVGSVEVATRKAKAAVYFKRPTKVFQDLVNEGNNAILALPNIVASEGGIPIVHEGKVIGAIGVSGVTSAQDGIIANAALESFQD